MSDLFGSVAPVPEWVTPEYQNKVSGEWFDRGAKAGQNFFEQQLRKHADTRSQETHDMEKERFSTILQADNLNLETQKLKLGQQQTEIDDQSLLGPALQKLSTAKTADEIASMPSPGFKSAKSMQAFEAAKANQLGLLGHTSTAISTGEMSDWVGQTMKQLTPYNRTVVIPLFDPKKPLWQQDQDFYDTLRNASDAQAKQQEDDKAAVLKSRETVRQIGADATVDAATIRSESAKDAAQMKIDAQAKSSSEKLESDALKWEGLSKKEAFDYKEEMLAARSGPDSFEEKQKRMQAVHDKWAEAMSKKSGKPLEREQLPPDRSKWEKGKIYQTAKGLGRWNGKEFERVK